MIHDYIKKLGSYQPPLEGREDYLLLDFNERTSPVSQDVEEALLDYVRRRRVQVYPAYAGGLVQSLASYSGVRQEELLLTNGSDHAIELVARALAFSRAVVPAGSFPFYAQVLRSSGFEIEFISYRPDFPFEELRALLDLNPRRLVVVPNPDNPTGTPADAATTAQLAAEYPETAFLVDECYFEYHQDSLLRQGVLKENVYVTRTFSKTWGLAAARIGYLVAAANNIEQFKKLRGPYDVNMFGVVAAQAALRAPEYMERYVKEVMTESKPLLEACLSKHQIRFWPSVANYLLTYPPEKVYEGLKAHGILTRPRSDPQGAPALRISIGTKAETIRLIDALEAVLAR